MSHTTINTDKNPTFGSCILEKFGTVFLVQVYKPLLLDRFFRQEL